MKTLFTVLFSLALIVSNQKSMAQFNLSLSGEVRKGFHAGMGSPYAISCGTWEVDIQVENIAGSTIRFDEVLVIWSALDCPGLQTVTTHTDESESKSSYFSLYPGETHDFYFTTNGYTYEIIGDAKGETIYFQTVFLYNEETVDLNMAPLPDLEDLSYDHGIPLRFF